MDTNVFRYQFAKYAGIFTYYLLKVLPTGGKSFPGSVFLRIDHMSGLKRLTKQRINTGSILLTGTNGKTTTTKMLIGLLKNDTTVSKSYENNTIYALTTALLSSKSDIGVFEYGIRDIAHGKPDQVQENVDPMGVLYTNISREHTQVGGVKNSFEQYIFAKRLLSANMKDGIIIVNADDPNTSFIGEDKSKDCDIIYYGFETRDIEDPFKCQEVKCPKCESTLEYSFHYMNQRGIYSCDCGFKRREPDIKVTSIKAIEDKIDVTIEGSLKNHQKKDIDVNINFSIPQIGFYNIYNALASTTAYLAFSPKPEGVEKVATNYFNNLDESIIPLGRFEIIKVGEKIIGIGQGDNGDALRVNAITMSNILDGNDLDLIYTTPDANEHEIFLDHLSIIEQLKPTHINVLPGRISEKAAKEYFDEMVEKNIEAEFHQVEYSFSKKVELIKDLISNSKFKYILVSGCGEEQALWEKIKILLKKESNLTE